MEQTQGKQKEWKKIIKPKLLIRGELEILEYNILNQTFVQIFTLGSLERRSIRKTVNVNSVVSDLLRHSVRNLL